MLFWISSWILLGLEGLCTLRDQRLVSTHQNRTCTLPLRSVLRFCEHIPYRSLLTSPHVNFSRVSRQPERLDRHCLKMKQKFHEMKQDAGGHVCVAFLLNRNPNEPMKLPYADPSKLEWAFPPSYRCPQHCSWNLFNKLEQSGIEPQTFSLHIMSCYWAMAPLLSEPQDGLISTRSSSSLHVSGGCFCSVAPTSWSHQSLSASQMTAPWATSLNAG